MQNNAEWKNYTDIEKIAAQSEAYNLAKIFAGNVSGKKVMKQNTGH